jgi:hypothetical protein
MNIFGESARIKLALRHPVLWHMLTNKEKQESEKILPCYGYMLMQTEQTLEKCKSVSISGKTYVKLYEHTDNNILCNVVREFPYNILHIENTTAELWEIACTKNSQLIDYAPPEFRKIFIGKLLTKENVNNLAKKYHKEFGYVDWARFCMFIDCDANYSIGSVNFSINMKKNGLIKKLTKKECVSCEDLSFLTKEELIGVFLFDNDSLCENALKYNGLLLQFIEKQSENTQRIAIENNPFAFAFAKNPSYEIKKLAVAKLQFNILLIDKPEEVLVKIVQYNEIICEHLLKIDGFYLKHINYQSMKDRMLAVEQNGLALEFVINKTMEICLAAILQNPEAKKFIPQEILEKITVKTPETNTQSPA